MDNELLKTIADQIKSDEGCRLDVYNDSLGFPTAGIGHLLPHDSPLKVGDKITQVQCDAYFQQDLAVAISGCRRLLSTFDALPDAAQAVLVNMCFNMGAGGLGEFHHFLAAVQNADWQEAVAEMQNSKWAKQLPARSGRLVSMIETIPDGEAAV